MYRRAIVDLRSSCDGETVSTEEGKTKHIIRYRSCTYGT